MRTNKNKVALSEINRQLREFLIGVEDASRKFNGNVEINYPYATGLLTSVLKHMVTLAATGGTAQEVIAALKMETMYLRR